MTTAVRRFAAAGGGVVGVCAGAFNVVWLGLIEADPFRAAPPPRPVLSDTDWVRAQEICAE